MRGRGQIAEARGEEQAGVTFFKELIPRNLAHGLQPLAGNRLSHKVTPPCPSPLTSHTLPCPSSLLASRTLSPAAPGEGQGGLEQARGDEEQAKRAKVEG